MIGELGEEGNLEGHGTHLGAANAAKMQWIAVLGCFSFRAWNGRHKTVDRGLAQVGRHEAGWMLGRQQW